MHQVQEESKFNPNKIFYRSERFQLTIIESFRECIADLCNGVKPPLRVRKSR
jgi:hypothetical protein